MRINENSERWKNKETDIFVFYIFTLHLKKKKNQGKIKYVFEPPENTTQI